MVGWFRARSDHVGELPRYQKVRVSDAKWAILNGAMAMQGSLEEDRRNLAHARTTVAQIEKLLGVKSSAPTRARKAPPTRGNPRVAKTKLVHVIQGNYGQGWEDLSEYEDTAEGRKLMRHDLKEYVYSRTGPVRSIKRRVSKEKGEP